jgi:hypothetical protein
MDKGFLVHFFKKEPLAFPSSFPKQQSDYLARHQ